VVRWVSELQLLRRPGVYVELSALALGLPSIFLTTRSSNFAKFKSRLPVFKLSDQTIARISPSLLVTQTFEDKMANAVSAPVIAGNNAAFKVCGKTLQHVLRRPIS
jgi:hypothetical protein